MKKKLVVFIKKHIEKVLMVIGVVLLVLFIMYTQKNNISTSNTWEAFIGFVLFYAPLLSGAWIASDKMKEKRENLSKAIKALIIFACLALLGSFISFLFTL